MAATHGERPQASQGKPGTISEHPLVSGRGVWSSAGASLLDARAREHETLCKEDPDMLCLPPSAGIYHSNVFVALTRAMTHCASRPPPEATNRPQAKEQARAFAD